jgi:hypothetical protein
MKGTEVKSERNKRQDTVEPMHLSCENAAPEEEKQAQEAEIRPNRIKKMKRVRSTEQQQERKRNRIRATQPKKDKI